jgi:hypothetical protein
VSVDQHQETSRPHDTLLVQNAMYRRRRRERKRSANYSFGHPQTNRVSAFELDSKGALPDVCQVSCVQPFMLLFALRGKSVLAHTCESTSTCSEYDMSTSTCRLPDATSFSRMLALPHRLAIAPAIWTHTQPPHTFRQMRAADLSGAKLCSLSASESPLI